MAYTSRSAYLKDKPENFPDLFSHSNFMAKVLNLNPKL